MRYDDVAVVGYGETAYHADDADQRDPRRYLADAIETALADAGVGPGDVDGFSAASFSLDRETVVSLARRYGIGGAWFHEATLGGFGPLGGLLGGARAIETGVADVVVVAAGDAMTTETMRELSGAFDGGVADYMAPYGFGGANGFFAMLQRRHMHDYGTTREQLAHVAVTQRDHARANPNAVLGPPMTVEDYLDARPIAEPVHLYDCVLPCGGGDAVVLASRDRAGDLDGPAVPLLAGAQYHNPNPAEAFALATGLDRCRDVFAAAGVPPGAVDALQLYDDYPIMVAIQLEELGFCSPGEGGPFVAGTDLSVTGELPLNTGGGQLSAGQAGAAGGLLGLVEAVRQLRGEGGDRQVPDPGTCLVTGLGNLSYGGGLASNAVLLGTGPEGAG